MKHHREYLMMPRGCPVVRVFNTDGSVTYITLDPHRTAGEIERVTV